MTFLVCSHSHWVGDDFSEALDGIHPVIYDFGLDLPKVPAGQVRGAWMPAIHAVRLSLSGYDLPLESPGANWLDTLDHQWTKRNIVTTTARNAMPVEGFWKLAEAKSHQELFESRWRTFTEAEEFLQALPPDSLVQVSYGFLEIKREERFFINRNLIHGTTYREGEWIYYSDMIDRPVLDDSYEFVGDLMSSIPAPATAYVVDIATLSNGDKAVLEANPIWCSGPYGADLRIVAEMICDSFEYRMRVWKPDNFLVHQAERMRKLS